MNILRRGVPEEKESAQKNTQPASIRRIEVTVERETITMLVRGQPGKASEAPTIEAEPEAPPQQK